MGECAGASNLQLDRCSSYRCCMCSPVLCSQAACRAIHGANERHSASTESYRIAVAASLYANELRNICGPLGAGNGKYGSYPFVVKVRPPSQGDNWTMEVSAVKRPQTPKSIYDQGKLAASKANNIYNPLCTLLLRLLYVAWLSL